VLKARSNRRNRRRGGGLCPTPLPTAYGKAAPLEVEAEGRLPAETMARSTRRGEGRACRPRGTRPNGTPAVPRRSDASTRARVLRRMQGSRRA